MKVFVVSAMLLAAAMAAPGVYDNRVNSEDGAFMKMIGNCADSGDVTTCLAVKGIIALNRAGRSQNIELLPGVTFTRDSSVSSRAGKALSENEIVSSLPANDEEKSGRLFDLALESAASFLGSHNLQVKIPEETTQSVARAIEEGRGKMKKLMGPLILAVGAKLLALIPIFLGGLVLLATKALIVSKIAFILAAVLGLQKLLGGGSGSGLNILGKVAGGGNSQGWSSAGQASNPGWSSGTGQGWSSGAAQGSYPYARSYDAQDMAYSAQAPAQ